MKLPIITVISLLVLSCSASCLAQDPLPVLKSSWQPALQKAPKTDVPQTGPAKQIIVDDTVGPRTSREFRTDHPDNPSDQTPDGRRAVIERNEEEAKMANPTDIRGFNYVASVRNDSSKTVKVIFWEYKFIEKKNPANVVRRQFLCSVDLKKNGEIDLSAFSTLGPADSIDAKTAASSSEKLYNESVRINRIEYSDNEILQRGDWKLAEVKAGVDRATARPWGKETCRLL
jgi:hypothetical protein